MCEVRSQQQLPIVPSKRDYLVMQSLDQTSDKLSSNLGPYPTNIMDQSQVCTRVDSSLQSVMFPNTKQSTIPYHSVTDTTGMLYY
jgi:hypothetical protein